MSRSMRLDEALRRTIDANVYFLPDPVVHTDESREDFRMAIGLPFTRLDDTWEFRLFIFHTSRIDRTPDEWDDDLRTGWGIERVTISPNTLDFEGDEVALHIQLIDSAGSVGAVATSFLDRWPNVDGNESPIEISTLFADSALEWHDLLAPTTTHKYH